MNKTIREKSRQLKVAGAFDVIVAGGGMAGVAAAVAAARNGAKTCIIEKQCTLGGLATLGNVTIWLPLCDGKGRQVIAGLGKELLKLSVTDLKRENVTARFMGIPSCWKPGGNTQERTKTRYRVDFNPASYMLALEKLVIGAGVKLFYDTRLCSIRRKGRRIAHVIVENKSGRFALSCGTVVDATGDADVCFLAGEKTKSLDSNVPAGWFYTFGKGELKQHPLSNSYCPIGTKKGGKGPFFRGDDGDQVTAHILRTRDLARAELAKLRAKHPGKDIQIIMPATIACMRMTRRLAGRFTIENKHMHRWFDDAIGLTGDWRRAGPVYAIPFGCLRGKRTDNLLAAGRCISAANTVWDVTRAIPPCVVTGEAAGTAAALAVYLTKGNMRSLDSQVLQNQLKKQGVLLDKELLTFSKT
ncbi:FAD-dependent oxidoreductase [Verrucomicrobiota bacterium]